MTVPEGMLLVEEFARIKNISPDKVLERIRSGIYSGRSVNGEWYVSTSDLYVSADKSTVKQEEILNGGVEEPDDELDANMQRIPGMAWIAAIVFCFVLPPLGIIILVALVIGTIISAFNSHEGHEVIKEMTGIKQETINRGWNGFKNGIDVVLKKIDELTNDEPIASSGIKEKNDFSQENNTSDTALVDFTKLLDRIGNEIYSMHGSEIKTEGESWIQQKKKEASTTKDYIDQLEKNAVYAVEGLFTALDTFTTFVVCATSPILTESFAVQHIENGRRISLHKADFHVQYLNDICDGCDFHYDHARYKGLSDIKRSGDIEKYVEELEFWCFFYRAMVACLTLYVRALLENRSFFAPFEHIPENEIRALIESRVKRFSNLSIDNMTFFSG